MGNRKSLGSSPIGYSRLSSNSYRFIRDLGISSKPDRSMNTEKPVENRSTGAENRNFSTGEEESTDTASEEGIDKDIGKAGQRDPSRDQRRHKIKYHSRKSTADLNRERHKNIDTEADSENRSGNQSGRKTDTGPEADFDYNTGKDSDASSNRRPGTGIDRNTNNFSDTNRDTNMENTPARKFTNIYTNRNTGKSANDESDSNNKQSDKKIVSYYLDKELIDRLKNLADDQNSYYSAVVSAAIRHWIEKHGY